MKATATRRRAIEAGHPEPSSKFSLLVAAMTVPKTQVTPSSQQKQNHPSAPGGDASNPGSSQASATLVAQEAMATPLAEPLQAGKCHFLNTARGGSDKRNQKLLLQR